MVPACRQNERRDKKSQEKIGRGRAGKSLDEHKKS